MEVGASFYGGALESLVALGLLSPVDNIREKEDSSEEDS